MIVLADEWGGGWGSDAKAINDGSRGIVNLLEIIAKRGSMAMVAKVMVVVAVVMALEVAEVAKMFIVYSGKAWLAGLQL